MKLAGGTAGSQAIMVATTPILTRLYGPESFGALATFLSILTLLNVVSSLRYELAIAVPEDDDEAMTLVWLCFAMVVFSTGLTALGALFFGDQLMVVLNEPALRSLLWLLPVGVLLSGIYQPLNYWAIRRKQFGLLARTKFFQSCLGVATNLAASPLGSAGLLLGQIVSQSAGFVTILRQSLVLLHHNLTLKNLARMLKKYNKFGIYSSPSGLINVFGAQFSILAFSYAFSAKDVGLLFFSQRILAIPVALIGASVAQVFLAQAPAYLRENCLLNMVNRTYLKLLRVGAIVFIPLIVIMVSLVPWIFGKEWAQSSLVLLIISPMVFTDFVVSSLSMTFAVINRPDKGLRAQLVLMIVRIGPLLLALKIFDFEKSLLIYSVSSAIGYAMYSLLLREAVRQEQSRIFLT